MLHQDCRDHEFAFPRPPRFATVLAGAYADDSSIEPIVVVAPAIRLAGHVVDEDGQRLAGAHLQLHLPEDLGAGLPHNLDRAKRIRWQSSSAADGQFVLDRVPGIAGSHLRVLLEPHAVEVFGVPTYTDEQMYVVLHRVQASDAVLVGRVVDGTGAVVAGARVGLGVTTQVTDRYGEFELSFARAGKASEILAIAKGYLPARFAPPRDAAGQPSWPSFVELRLPGEALEDRGEHHPVRRPSRRSVKFQTPAVLSSE